MIPVLAGLASRFLQPFLIGAVVVASAGWALTWFQNVGLRSEVAALELRIADMKTQAAEALAAAAEKARTIEASAVEVQNRMRNEHAKEIAAVDARLSDAHRRLRDSERARLRPAETAPTEHREYAASPTQLSVPDAAFLTGEADRADRIVVQLRACQRELAGVIDAVNREIE